jgi:hypothetical protein
LCDVQSLFRLPGVPEPVSGPLCGPEVRAGALCFVVPEPVLVCPRGVALCVDACELLCEDEDEDDCCC